MGGGSSPPSHPCPLFSFLLFKALLKCLGRTGSLLTETSELLKVTEMVASRWHQHGGQNWVFTLLALHCAECYDWPLGFVFDSVGYAHSMIIMESKISLTVNYDTKVSMRCFLKFDPWGRWGWFRLVGLGLSFNAVGLLKWGSGMLLVQCARLIAMGDWK